MTGSERLFLNLGELMKTLVDGVASVVVKNYSQAKEDIHKARNLVDALRNEGFISDSTQEGIIIILDSIEACLEPENMKQLGKRLTWWFMFNTLSLIRDLAQHVLDTWGPEDFSN